jgi:hypothetical protein
LLYAANPDDLLIGRLFAKCLMAIDTFDGFRDIFRFIFEDFDKQRQNDEALKICESLN